MNKNSNQEWWVKWKIVTENVRVRSDNKATTKGIE